MTGELLFDILLLFMFAAALATIAALFFVTAPYGRHARAGWGLRIGDKLAWIVMEAPAPIVFALCFALGPHAGSVPAAIFFVLWQSHYIHRAFFYPFGLRHGSRGMPLAIAGVGFVFNAANGYLNGRHIFTLSGGYPDDWLSDARFLGGVALFACGYVINRLSDRTLRRLRRPDEDQYHIPYGGMYRWISSPNYFGEIVEWTGWALATWSLPGLAFAVWCVANLVPRARAHHHWYRERFPDYPAERRALVPGVW